MSTDTDYNSDGEFDMEDILAHCESLEAEEGDFDETIWTWRLIDDYHTVVDLDGIDQDLLNLAREEVPVILDRLKLKLFGRRSRIISKVSPLNFLKAWIDPTLLGFLKSFLNKNLTAPVSDSEILAFIRVELMLSFYKVSPSMYFDPEERCHFPSAGQGMDNKRYSEILKAMGTSSNYKSTNLRWNPPKAHDRDIASAMDVVRRTCAEIAFVSGVTRVGLDDDLLRMRSKRAVAAGFQHTNNPAKGLGVIHHGAVSCVTGLYLGGHVASKGESTLDCVKIVQRSLCGASVESQINLNGNLFLWDRGYGGTDGEVNQWSMKAEANLLGTSKRMTSFPFTFDQIPGPNRQLIQMKGSFAQYWAYKSPPGLPDVKQFALAHRSGLGRVVLMQSTFPAAGPGRFSYISKGRRDPPAAPVRNAFLLRFETENIDMVTAAQGDPVWFLQRKFRITGSGAALVWKWLAQKFIKEPQQDEIPQYLQVIFRILCIKYSELPNSIDDESSAERTYEAEELKFLNMQMLKDICKAKKLLVGGNKADLINRIVAFDFPGRSAADQPSQSIEQLLLNTWFMAPFKGTEAMVAGLINESNIISKLQEFFEKESDIRVDCIRKYGLLCSKRRFYAAFSPDGIVVAVSPTFGNVVALLELKSKISRQTERQEEKLSDTYGRMFVVNASLDSIAFKKAIPDRGHRGQLVHGMASGNLRFAFYVVASLRKIIRVVMVEVEPDDLLMYMRALKYIYETHLNWVLSGSVPVLEVANMGHAVDQHTIVKTLDLWRAIRRLIVERGRPLPPCRFILPSMVAIWNRCKGPIDVFSRFLKNVHAHHSHLKPVANIWLRLIMSMIYNAYQSYILSRSIDFLKSEDCQSYNMYQSFKRRIGSFAKFCSTLANDLSLEVSGGGLSDNDEDIEIDGNDEGASRNRTSINIAYNKRKIFFTNPELVAKRMDANLDHKPLIEDKQFSCVWCCRKSHTGIGSSKHSRHGRKTKKKCSICEVPLCTTERFNGNSCFHLFHISRELFDPCNTDVDEITTVRGHSNRPDPPRRRQRTDEDGEAVVSPTRRSRIAVTVMESNRRSVRRRR